MIPLDSAEGRRLLEESETRKGFVSLVCHFVTQDNLTYCGVASSAMALNALGLERPVAEPQAPYRLFDQVNFFTEEVKRVVDPSKVGKMGMTLGELGAALGTYPVKVETIHAEGASIAAFRDSARAALAGDGRIVLVNYLRRAVGQESGGHISPLGAYHAESDRFLILDVSRYKYGPVWVATKDLWRAMLEVDSESGRSRGYVVVATIDSSQDP